MTRRQIVLLLFIFVCSLYAVNINDISSALDLTGQSGIELVSFSKRVYNVAYDKDWGEYDYVYDSNDEPTYKDSSNAGWGVQSSASDNKKYSTYPIKGNSCLRSGLPTDLKKSSDAQEARLVFKVYGPGTFSFFYKTSCDEDDALKVYVDGEPTFFSESGYGENSEYDWGYSVNGQTGEELEAENRAEIEVDGGTATSGPYEGSYYHEIMIVFEKDLPKTDWDGNYVPDGPEKPEKSWYEDDDEGYKEAMADYNAEMALFFNSVWIDWVQWTPLSITLELTDVKEPLLDADGKYTYDEEGNVLYKNYDKDGNFLDEATILLSTEASEMGYPVRFTVDGSDPTSSSPEFDFEEEANLTLTQSCTLKAAVFVGDAIETTVGIVSKEVTVKATAPSLELDAEHSTDAVLVLKATKQYADNLIVYSTDGTEPTENSTTYDAEAGIVIANSCTVRARCVRDGILASEVVSKSVEKLPTPTYRLLDAENVEEPNGITTGDELKLKADNSSGTLKYGISETDITEDFPEDGLSVSAGETYYLRNVEAGKLSSEIVRVQVKKADATIVFGEGDYALKPGWNLVSFPIQMTNASLQALLKKWNLFGYNVEQQCYQRATAVKPGCGYWVFQKNVAEAVGVELNGCMATETEAGGAGWNLVGPVKGQSFFESNEVWSYSNGAYIPLKNSEKPALWKGYMVRFQ